MAFAISQDAMELEQFLLRVQRDWLDVRGSDEPIVRIGHTVLPVSQMIALVQLREHAHSRDALAQAARTHTRVDRKIGNFILRTYFVDGQPDAWDVYRNGGRRIGTYKTSEGAQRAIARWTRKDNAERVELLRRTLRDNPRLGRFDQLSIRSELKKLDALDAESDRLTQ